VSGACRSQELVKLKIEDIEEIKLGLLVKIPHTKTKKPRSFTVMGENCLRTYRKYLALRPKNFNERRLFIKYQDGVCHRQVVGIDKISSVPQEVAKYLNLENVNEYSGHCLRRTSATLLVDSGGDMTSLKRHGGWKSDSVAEGYIEQSLKHKEDVARYIFRLDESSTSTSTSGMITHEEPTNGNEVKVSSNNQIAATLTNIVNNSTKTDTSDGKSLIHFSQSCSNCTFYFNFKI
jgi:hypothetical protein